MNHQDKTTVQFFKIGATMYAVHKRFKDEKIVGGRVIVCRVKTFENRGGEILPVLTEVGNAKREINPVTHYFFDQIDEAVEAITTKE